VYVLRVWSGGLCPHNRCSSRNVDAVGKHVGVRGVPRIVKPLADASLARDLAERIGERERAQRRSERVREHESGFAVARPPRDGSQSQART
jgi:hypothetical protein